MKKRVVIFYVLSLFAGIGVLMWIVEMVRGEFPQEDTGGFCLALFCCLFFFFLAWRASKKAPPKTN